MDLHHKTKYYAKCLAEKCLVFWASPLSLYIFRHCALPSLCEASHKDGVGESFEQREIRVGDGLEIYAHLWQSKGWSIVPERDRFDPHFSERLPDMCFTVLPEDGALAYIIKGDELRRSEDSSDTPEVNRHMADCYNKEWGISEAQVRAMEGGCQHGWDSPAADPRAYGQTQAQPQIGGMDFA